MFSLYLRFLFAEFLTHVPQEEVSTSAAQFFLRPAAFSGINSLDLVCHSSVNMPHATRSTKSDYFVILEAYNNPTNQALIQTLFNLNHKADQHTCSNCLLYVDECRFIIVFHLCRHWICLDCYDKWAKFYDEIIRIPRLLDCVFPGCRISVRSFQNNQVILRDDDETFRQCFSCLDTPMNVCQLSGDFITPRLNISNERSSLLAVKGQVRLFIPAQLADINKSIQNLSK